MTFSITPRPYQNEAKEAVLSGLEKGVTRQLVTLPTGCGKTILFGLLTKELKTKTLIIAHREQLIKQAEQKIKLVWPEAETGVCMAERNEIGAQVVIASIQSASKPQRLAQLREQGFSFCVVDEAHHCASPSYKTLLNELGFLHGNLDKLLLGVTATPQRKGGGLGDIFEEVIFERSLPVMIRGGYLSDLKGKRVLTSTSLEGVSTSRGDFVECQLSEVCNSPERNALIAGSFLEHCPERKAIAFCCDVQHAKDLADMFKKKGVQAAAIFGAMTDEEKESIMRDYSKGKVQVLTNCSLLVEGYDEPDVSAVLMCRPTRSQPLYVQCVGRGTRLHPNKTDCLVLDFCDNFHDLESIATLERAIGQEEEKERETSQEKQEKEPQSVFIKKQIVGDFELFDRSRFAWTCVKEHWLLQLSPSASIWLKKDGDGYLPTIEEEGQHTPLASQSIPLEYAMGLSEDYLRKNKSFESWSSVEAEWRKDSPSEKQIEILKRMGIDPSGITKGEATQLIGQRFNERQLWKHEPATSSQRYFLSKNGIAYSPPLTKGKAANLISAHKKGELARPR